MDNIFTHKDKDIRYKRYKRFGNKILFSIDIILILILTGCGNNLDFDISNFAKDLIEVAGIQSNELKSIDRTGIEYFSNSNNITTSYSSESIINNGVSSLVGSTLEGVKYTDYNVKTLVDLKNNKSIGTAKQTIAHEKSQVLSNEWSSGRLSYSDGSYTSPDYLIRMYDGRYFVAIGQNFKYKETETDIDFDGRYVDFIMEDGSVFKAIIGDAKSSNDTLSAGGWGHWVGSIHSQNICIIELILDMPTYYSDGNLIAYKGSYAQAWVTLMKARYGKEYYKQMGLDKKVITVRVYDKQFNGMKVSKALADENKKLSMKAFGVNNAKMGIKTINTDDVLQEIKKAGGI